MIVTGSAGFVGFYVSKLLLEKSYEVVGIDAMLSNLYSSAEKYTRLRTLRENPNFSFVEHDLRNSLGSQLVNSKIRDADFLIHLAAMPGLRLSWEDYELYSGCNSNGTLNAVELARQVNAHKFIHISTSSVYGTTAIGNELAPLNPSSPYGITKLAAENIVRVYGSQYGLDYSILRLFSVYGPHQRPDMAYRRMIESALNGTPQSIFGDGTQSRTNTYVEDAARAIVKSVSKSVPGETYNIAGSEPVSLLEAIDLIQALTGREVSKVFKPPIRGDQIRTHADISKSLQRFGDYNTVSITEGLKRQVEWVISSGKGKS